MTNTEQTVAVVIPAHNHGQYIARAIASLWEQTCMPSEIVVVDDASKDDTYEIAHNLSLRSPVPMRVYRNQTNEGTPKTLNRAIAASKSTLVGFVASDDYYHPDKLRRQLMHLARMGPTYGLIHCNATSVDEQDTPLGTIIPSGSPGTREGWLFRDIVIGRPRFVSGTMLVYRSVITAIGGFDDRLRAEDFDFHLRAARHCALAYVDEPLYFSRTLSGSLGRKPWLWADDIIAAIEKHRDVLGPETDRIISMRLAQIANSALLLEDYTQAVRFAEQAVARADSPNVALRILGMIFAGVTVYGAKKSLSRPIPRSIRRYTYQFLRRHRFI